MFTLMQQLTAAGPESQVTGPNGRQYTLRNLAELQKQYDWLGVKIAGGQRAAEAATAAGGGAGVIEFGRPGR